MGARTAIDPTTPWGRLQTLLQRGPAAASTLSPDAHSLSAVIEENGRLFNTMVDAFDGLIYICSTDFRIEYLNRRMIDHFGGDATGQLCYQAFGRTAVCPWCNHQRVFNGETLRWEAISPRDGRWYHVTNAPIRHADGTLSKYTLMVDIHDRKKNEEELLRHRDHLEELVRARTVELTFSNTQLRNEIQERIEIEKALRQSEAKYRDLVQNANSIIIRFDTQGRITFFNEYAQHFFGFSEGEILGHTMIDTILPTVRSNGRSIMGEIEDFMRGPERFEINELENMRRNGERVWVTWTNRPILDAQGNVTEFLWVGVDVTERRQTRRQIKTLTHELIKAQENERYRIARDLHDHIAQDLSSLKIRLQTLFGACTTLGEESRQQINDVINILQRSISDVRNLAYDLRPPGLDQLGLVRTLFVYCEDFAQTNNLKIDFIAAGLDDLILDEDIQINIYRLIQEALHNVKKHAQAKGVTIRLVTSSPNLILRIIDDGKGFDASRWRAKAYKEKRMGLQSMVERVGLLGGTIDIRAHDQKGTGIFISIPIKEQLREREEAHPDH
ncbi:MAG: PAS domain S-box protein [Desulfobacteraceae bacterium]|nr:PAS domain S-box protein [Desulfobacteraceae bacterium]